MRKDKKLIINPDESEIVERIFDLYYKGKSYQAIVNIFNEEKLKDKNILESEKDLLLHTIEDTNY